MFLESKREKMNNLQQVERIKIKLRLAKNTDPFFETFGSDSHQYHLEPPLNTNEIEAFEYKYNIQLPICYKTFLSEVGNGGFEYSNSVVGNSGAGPSYGIYNLGNFRQFIADISLQYLENDVYFDASMTSNNWAQMYAEMDENISDNDYEKWVAKVYSGILIIGYCGCSNYYGILLNGKDTGRVLYAYDEMHYCPHFVEQNTFLDFYENWLNEIIYPKKEKTISMTEKECFERFLSDNNREAYWKKNSLIYLRKLENISKATMEELWKLWKLENDLIVQTFWLSIFVKHDYEKSKPELNQLSRHKPMEFLRLLHLYAPQHTKEWKTTIKEIQQTASLNSETIEYIKYLTIKDLDNN